MAMQRQSPCAQCKYPDQPTSYAKHTVKISTFADTLLTLNEEQYEDTTTMCTTSYDPSSESSKACQDRNDHYISNQLNRNSNDGVDDNEDAGSHEAIIAYLDGNSKDYKAAEVNNELSDECENLVVYDIPTFITPSPSSDDDECSNDTVSELGLDAALNDNPRCIFSNYWNGKESKYLPGPGISKSSSYCTSSTSMSSSTLHSNISDAKPLAYSTKAAMCISKKFDDSGMYAEEHGATWQAISPDDELVETDKTSAIDDPSIKAEYTNPLQKKCEHNPLHPSPQTFSRRNIFSNNYYKSMDDYIPKVSSTSALLPARRIHGKQKQGSCLRPLGRSSSAAVPGAVNACREVGGKVTFDPDVSVVEYDQQFTMRASAGWSKFFM